MPTATAAGAAPRACPPPPPAATAGGFGVGTLALCLLAGGAIGFLVATMLAKKQPASALDNSIYGDDKNPMG